MTLLLTISAWLPAPEMVVAAGTERQVEIDPARKVDPVLVTQVALGSAIVQSPRFGPLDAVTPFQAGDDWLQSLSIHLLNRTSQTIVYADIVLGFPETTENNTKRMYVAPLNFGRIPEAVAIDGRTGKLHLQPADLRPLAFASDQTMVIRLGDHIERIRDSIGSSGWSLAALHKVRIFVGSFYFADGMTFAANGYFTPDNVGRWVLMPMTYFPGDPNRNWPGRPDQIRPEGVR
jgi:hypothetical protein